MTRVGGKRSDNLRQANITSASLVAWRRLRAHSKDLDAGPMDKFIDFGLDVSISSCDFSKIVKIWAASLTMIRRSDGREAWVGWGHEGVVASGVRASGE